MLGLIDNAKMNATLMKEGQRLTNYMQSVDKSQKEIASVMNDNFKILNNNLKELYNKIIDLEKCLKS